MATSSTGVRESVEAYGIGGAIGVAILAGVVFFAVHEVFHILLGFGVLIDTIGSVALGAVAALGVLALGWNLRAVVATFIVMFGAHSLVMGYGGLLLLDNFGGSMPVGVVAAIVFFLAAGGLTE